MFQRNVSLVDLIGKDTKWVSNVYKAILTFPILPVLWCTLNEFFQFYRLTCSWGGTDFPMTWQKTKCIAQTQTQVSLNVNQPYHLSLEFDTQTFHTEKKESFL